MNGNGEFTATKNRVDVLSILAAASSSLFIAVGGYVVNQHAEHIDRIESKISAIDIRDTIASEQIFAQNEKFKYWISVIESRELICRSLDSRVTKLEHSIEVLFNK